MKTVISAENLIKSYDNKNVVDHISLNVKEGEIFGILGPNGAGKTTTLEMLEGIRMPDSGVISILGLCPQKDIVELNKYIGIQFQATSLQNKLKVGEAINLFGSLYEHNASKAHIIENLGLENYLDTYFEDLSGGLKQRLMLALAVLHDPKILFLDEPSTGLDPKARKDLWEFINLLKKEGKTIVLSTHYMEEARQLCDRVAMFHKGKILAIDTPSGLVAKYNAQKYIELDSLNAEIKVLQKLPSVTKIEKTDNTLTIHSDNLQEVAFEIFRLANEHNWQIDNFAFAMTSLEDLFVNLSEGELDEPVQTS